ncbi:MAG TPA: hypothetical protein VJ867_17255 [Gemmatimonadaceae bacterium]|nr:hypothetical protein [Gemmatimonadaceae bacterium]
MVIRQANTHDAASIADVLVHSWRRTYREIVARSYLNAMSVEAQTRRWQKRFDDEGAITALVASDETDRVVGFAAGGRLRERHAGFDGELYPLYLL